MTNDNDWPDCDDTCTTPRKRAQLEEIADGAFTEKKLTVGFIKQLRDYVRHQGGNPDLFNKKLEPDEELLAVFNTEGQFVRYVIAKKGYVRGDK